MIAAVWTATLSLVVSAFAAVGSPDGLITLGFLAIIVPSLVRLLRRA